MTRTNANRPSTSTPAGVVRQGSVSHASAGSRSASARTDSCLRSGRATVLGLPVGPCRSGTLKRVSGPKTRQVLAKGISLDLDARVFKPGDVALTLAEHIAVQLWQVDDRPSYEIAMFRSLAGSFWHWLAASAEEFGYEVVEE